MTCAVVALAENDLAGRRMHDPHLATTRYGARLGRHGHGQCTVMHQHLLARSDGPVRVAQRAIALNAEFTPVVVVIDMSHEDSPLSLLLM